MVCPIVALGGGLGTVKWNWVYTSGVGSNLNSAWVASEGTVADPAQAVPGVSSWNACVRVLTDVSRQLSVGIGLKCL